MHKNIKAYHASRLRRVVFPGTQKDANRGVVDVALAILLLQSDTFIVVVIHIYHIAKCQKRRDRMCEDASLYWQLVLLELLELLEKHDKGQLILFSHQL